MELTTLGREMVRAKLPDAYKGWADKTLDKKQLSSLMTKLALEDPDRYVQILQDLNQIGEDVVSMYGRDAALSYIDSVPSKETMALNKQLRALVDKVMDDDSLTEEQKEQKIIDIGYKYTQKVQDAVFEDQDKRHTALASQINSGSRGNKTQLMQLMFGNMMMKDALSRDIPYLHMDPYIYGASPFSYWVAASSGRKGFYDVQAATGQAGYLGKQVTNVTHDVVIEKDDCGTTDTGVPFKAADSQNVGHVLLRPFHNHPAGSIVTPDMVAEADDDEEMVLRSPMTCKCRYGICAKCSGLAENGKFPGVGSYVPLNSSRAFVEKVTQAGISCLHPDTLVRMADWSVKPIKDIHVGDMVIGVDMHGRGRPVTVTATFNHGPMPMVMASYRMGFKTQRMATLIATTEHKALQSTYKSMCKGEIFNNTPRILPVGEPCSKTSMIPLQSMEPWPGEHHDEALFLGLMAGDGCYTEGVLLQPHFSCADKKLIDDTKEYLATLDIELVFHKGSQCYWRVKQLSKANVPGRQTVKSAARRYLDAAGMTGKYAYEKEFPVGYEKWDSASISAYISGLIITDGSLFRSSDTNEPRVSFGSTSEKLTHTLCDMLTKHCGITPPAVHTTSDNDGWHKRTMYCVTFGRKADIRTLLRFLRLYGCKEALRHEFLEELDAWYYEARKAEKLLQWRRQRMVQVGYYEALDIAVDHPDHLFLLANGLVVSNSKHKGGVGGKRTIDEDGEDQPTGFKSIERMFMAPSNFPGGAVLAPVDGRVNSIKPASQGGNYITVGTQTMYCSPERTFKVHVGDTVSAGDVLTNGVPNPAEVMKYKGVGAGRKYYVGKLGDIFDKAGFGVDRSNLESFTRAMLNKVRIGDDGYRDWLPGEHVSYNEIAADWKPRDNAVKTTVDKAANMYLEEPVLNYTIGTRITPEVAKNLNKYGFKDVTVNSDPPPFNSEFMRPAQALQNDRNWLPRLAGERLRDGLFDAARKGITDSYDSPSYVDKIVAAPFK